MIPERKLVTFNEFVTMDRTNIHAEYINNMIYYQVSPSVAHQSIVTKLSIEIGSYLKGKIYQLFVSPLDIILQDKNERHVVQPDLSIIYDKNGFTENNYTGVPTIVIQVLSPSTSSVDYITKMDLYMRFGVKEYWIVSPKNNTIEIFVLENGIYGEPQIYSLGKTIVSNIFEGMEIDLANIF